MGLWKSHSHTQQKDVDTHGSRYFQDGKTFGHEVHIIRRFQVFYSFPAILWGVYPLQLSPEKVKAISIYIYILVGGWATPLKNMKVNWDDDIPNINGKIIQMATKPPTSIYIYISIWPCHVVRALGVSIWSWGPGGTPRLAAWLGCERENPMNIWMMTRARPMTSETSKLEIPGYLPSVRPL